MTNEAVKIILALFLTFIGGGMIGGAAMAMLAASGRASVEEEMLERCMNCVLMNRGDD